MTRTRGGWGCTASLWRAVRHPVAVPLWALLAAWSFLTLKQQRTYGDISLMNLGQIANGILGDDAGMARRGSWSYDLYAVREDDRWRVIDTNPDSTDELMRWWNDKPERVVQVMVVLEDEFEGMVAFTHLHMRDGMTFAPFSDRTLSHEESQAIRRAIADHLLLVHPGTALDSEIAGRIARLRAADGVRGVTLGVGYVVDAGLLVGVAMTTLSLAHTVAMIPAVGRRPREWWRRRGGRCVRCGYPVAGIVGGVCPECGTPITPAGDGARR